MRKKVAGVAVLAACALGLAGPSSALAQDECNNSVDCAIVFVNGEKDKLLDQVNDLLILVDEEKDKLLAEIDGRAGGAVHECVVRARIKPDGTGSGVSNCVRRYYRTNTVERNQGVVTITGASIVSTGLTSAVSFNGATDPIVIAEDNGLHTVVDHLSDRARHGTIAVSSGEYTGAGPARTAVGAFNTLPGSLLGAGGDHFIDGTLTLTGIA